MEDFSSKLVQKNMEISKQKSVLEEQIDKYKRKISDLEMRSCQQTKLQVNPETMHRQEPDQQTTVGGLVQRHPDQKPVVNGSSLPSQQSEVKKLKPSQIRGPNFLEKYDFKKLTHFEKLQEERRHQIQNLDSDNAKPEVEVSTSYDDAEYDGEVNLPNRVICEKYKKRILS
jgi:hypothetical protein